MTTSESAEILVSERSATGVVTLTLNRPPANAMSPELIDELQDAVDLLAEITEQLAGGATRAIGQVSGSLYRV